MLRITFSHQDLARVRVAAAPDPMWEITNSLDRLQTSEGRWAFAPWFRETRALLADSELRHAVRDFLIPLLPRASYFPDFLTPAEGREGLEAGIEAILRTPKSRVHAEIDTLARLHHAPDWAHRLADGDLRGKLGTTLRAYHQQVIAPHENAIRAAVDGDRVRRARELLDGGVEQLLDSYRPMMRWRPPVLEVSYPETRDIQLNGSGLLLVPSYFCWGRPVALADPTLPPVLIYPLPRTPGPVLDGLHDEAAAALMGTARAAVLRATTSGMTTGEIARFVGVSAPTASYHLNVLRDSSLITSNRRANTVLHILTPLGAAVLGLR